MKAGNSLNSHVICVIKDVAILFGILISKPPLSWAKITSIIYYGNKTLYELNSSYLLNILFLVTPM